MNSDNQQTRLKLDRSVPFVEAVFRIIEGKGTEAEAVRILHDAESAHGVKVSIKPANKALTEIAIDQFSQLVEAPMLRFLSGTHLVIGSAEFSRMHFVIAETYTYKWTDREWAHMLANWANETKWLGSNAWNYLDFYGGPNDLLIENYNAWCEAVMRVIRIKSSS